MKKVYLVKDEKVGNMNILVDDEHHEVAIFNFACALAQQNAMEFGRPEDYSLYDCGLFAPDTFEVTDPVFVCNGLTALNDYHEKLKKRGVKKYGYTDLAQESRD